MNSEANFKQIKNKKSDAVVSFENGTTFKIDKLMEQVNCFFQSSVLDGLSSRLNKIGLGNTPHYKCSLYRGVNAEVLEPQSGEWKKGKVRMRVVLEFCPDEPEVIENDVNLQNGNSLDDIRQTIT